MPKSAVFLDRDGVLNIEIGYIHNLTDLNLIPGAAQAVRQLNDQGIFCCLISNQSGPARNYYSKKHVDVSGHSGSNRVRRSHPQGHLSASLPTRLHCP